MSRWILTKPQDNDDSPVANAGKLVLNSIPALKDSIRSAAKKVSGDEDLSDKGKQRRIAKEAVDGISRFREAQKRVAKDLAEQRAKVQRRTKEKLPDASFEEKALIIPWLRGLSVEDRSRVLRDAAAGRMAGSDTIMQSVVSSFPALLGMRDEDPLVQMVRDQWLSRVAPTSITELADLDEAEAAVRLAGEELEAFGREIGGESFAEALDVLEGRKPWSSLTVAEKAEEIAKGGNVVDLMKRGVEKTDDDYKREEIRRLKAEEADAFSRMSLKEKVEAVQSPTDWDDVEASLVVVERSN